MNEVVVLTDVAVIRSIMGGREPMEYMGKWVAPSKVYAEFSKKEIRNVNQVITRLEDYGKLIEGVDIFRLDAQMVSDLDTKLCSAQITENSVIYSLRQLSDSRHGVILLTRSAIDIMSHYFNDPNSVALSKEVNALATDAREMSSLALTSQIANSLSRMEEHLISLDNNYADIQSRVYTMEGSLAFLSCIFDMDDKVDAVLSNIKDLISNDARRKLKYATHGYVNQSIKELALEIKRVSDKVDKESMQFRTPPPPLPKTPNEIYKYREAARLKNIPLPRESEKERVYRELMEELIAEENDPVNIAARKEVRESLL